MQELFSSESVQAEVSDIGRAIEARREALAVERGIVSERDVVRHVLDETLFSRTTATPVVSSPRPTGHYLDNLSEEETQTINSYIERIPETGLARAVDLVRGEHPFLVDAFHDVLTDKLYEELKVHGLVE